MLKETEITINATKSIKAKYDECAKALFKNPEILAPILKYVVPEYKDYTAEEIVDFIVKDSIDEPPVDSVSTMANQLGTEMNSLGEKKICYDMHFKAINPKLSNSKTTIYLHMDLEIQNDYRPGNPKYPIVKRGIYYGAREISSQLGVLTGKTNYNDVEKVYSVWICNENIPKELQNTVTEYTIKKNEVIGKVDEPEADYDLLSVIMGRLGSNEGKEEIFDYLNSVFKGDVEKVKEYIDIEDNEDIVEGVNGMDGFSESISRRAENRGFQKGLQEGLQMIYRLVEKGLVKISDAAVEANMTEEEFKKGFEEYSKKENK